MHLGFEVEGVKLGSNLGLSLGLAAPGVRLRVQVTGGVNILHHPTSTDKWRLQ